jgi:hypothetical protein
VFLEVFDVFLSAIEGNATEVRHENLDDLWVLCAEFQFWSDDENCYQEGSE